MAEKKKQHYIPQFYMRFFADSNKEFSVCNVNNQAIYPHIPYRDQCYKNYFYGEDKVLENQFSVLEGQWKETIQKANNFCPLDPIDCDVLKQFMVYQRQRTLGDNLFTQQSEIQMNIECIKTIYAYHGVPFEGPTKGSCLKAVTEQSTELGSLNFVTECLKSILDLDVLVIHYDTHRKLISSDVPIVAINPFHQCSIGYGCMGFILLAPISPHNLLLAYDGKMYPRYVGKQYISLHNESEVFHLNVLQMISAHKIIFGREINELQEFKKENWEERQNSRDIAPVGTLGPEPNKMIYMSPRKVIHNHIFSFGQMKQDFNMIPFVCREAAPRVYDVGWENKFRQKIQIMPKLMGLLYKDSDNSDVRYTTKQIYNGCKAMLKAAQKYWQTDLNN